MEITEVQVKLINDGDDRLKASCTIAIDGEFVIRDVKVIEGTNGLFVAMPSRKLTDHCPKCSSRNHLRSKFCNNCGAKLNENRGARRGGKPTQLHTEIAHPINSACRERLHNSVIEAYQRELELAGEPREQAAPRRSRQEEDVDVEVSSDSEYEQMVSELKSEAQQRRGRDEPEPVASDEEYEDIADDESAEEGEAENSNVRVSERGEPPRPAPPAPPSDDFGAGLL